MRKILTILVISFFSFLGACIPVNAFTLSPSSGSFDEGVTQTISIIADPPENAEAIQIRIILSGNAIITGYTSPSGSQWGPGGIGVCNGGTTFTSNEICVDLANTGTINTGESLGSFTILTGDSGIATLTKDSDNGYLVGSVIQADTGTAGTYTIGTGISTLPDTSIANSEELLYVLVGVSLISGGTFMYLVFPGFMERVRKILRKENMNDFLSEG